MYTSSLSAPDRPHVKYFTSAAPEHDGQVGDITPCVSTSLQAVFSVLPLFMIFMHRIHAALLTHHACATSGDQQSCAGVVGETPTISASCKPSPIETILALLVPFLHSNCKNRGTCNVGRGNALEAHSLDTCAAASDRAQLCKRGALL